MRRLLLLLPLAIAGCPEGVDGDDPKPPPPFVLGDCTPTAGEQTLEGVQQRFVDDVYPLMARADGGCIACHADDSGRQLRMARDGAQAAAATFLRLRSGGWLERKAGTMVFRVADESMPQGGPAWTEAEVKVLDQLACDLAVVDGGEDTPLDEQFPPELLLPYDGPPVTDYDNTFLTYNQLRGRTLEVFDDEWVREGVDQFSANIALFGGVDFIATFVPARNATPEFLAGLDLLAEDVCQRASADLTGPFAGLDLAASPVDAPPPTTTTFQAEDLENVGNACPPNPGDTQVVLCTTSSVQVLHTFPTGGDYRIAARVRADPNGNGPPNLAVRIDGTDLGDADVPGSANTTITITGRVEAGEHLLALHFTNDDVDDNDDDRNLFIDSFVLEGPLEGTSDGVDGGADAARAQVRTLLERTLQRPSSAADDVDVDGLYQVLLDLDAFEPGDRPRAWAGVCEA